MSTENEQNAATQPASKSEDSSSQRTGLIRKSHNSGIARNRRLDILGLPLTPYEMLRLSPFSLFRRMTDEFDRAIQPLLSNDAASANITWTPTVEVSESDGKYSVLAELPGLSPNDVHVEVEDDALIIQGERQVNREASEGGVRRSERQFGLFYRRLPIPEGINPEQIKAQFHDGILEITMPIATKQANRRQIQVTADSKSSSDQTKQAA
jgi:HSP20 family protein